MKKDKENRENDEDQKKSEEEIDQELEQTFPASDPPGSLPPSLERDADGRLAVGAGGVERALTGQAE